MISKLNIILQNNAFYNCNNNELIYTTVQKVGVYMIFLYIWKKSMFTKAAFIWLKIQ